MEIIIEGDKYQYSITLLDWAVVIRARYTLDGYNKTMAKHSYKVRKTKDGKVYYYQDMYIPASFILSGLNADFSDDRKKTIEEIKKWLSDIQKKTEAQTIIPTTLEE